MFRHFVGVVGSCVLMASVVGAAEHTTDTLEMVRTNLKDGKAVLLDVREDDEWKAGHLADAHLAPLSQMKAGANLEEVKKLAAGKIVYVHCRSGKRALQAADLLKAAGHDVRALKAGYGDLLEAGFPKAP